VTREEAWQLVCEWISNENLRRHLLAVEAAMRFYARKFGEDEEQWGIVGLLHDLDYERHPEPPDHPRVGAEFLRQKGLPEEMVRAILAHADWTGVPRDTLMAKALFACDELTGFPRRLRPRHAQQKTQRSAGGQRFAQDEGQVLRPQGQQGRHRERGRRVGRAVGRTHRQCPDRYAQHRRPVGAVNRKG